MLLLPPNEGGVAVRCRCGLFPLVHGILLDYDGLNASLEFFLDIALVSWGTWNFWGIWVWRLSPSWIRAAWLSIQARSSPQIYDRYSGWAQNLSRVVPPQWCFLSDTADGGGDCTCFPWIFLSPYIHSYIVAPPYPFMVIAVMKQPPWCWRWLGIPGTRK